jgi:hypothetical protein
MTRRVLSDVGLGILVALGAFLCFLTPDIGLRSYLALGLWITGMIARALFLARDATVRTNGTLVAAAAHGLLLGFVAAGTLAGMAIWVLQQSLEEHI